MPYPIFQPHPRWYFACSISTGTGTNLFDASPISLLPMGDGEIADLIDTAAVPTGNTWPWIATHPFPSPILGLSYSTHKKRWYAAVKPNSTDHDLLDADDYFTASTTILADAVADAGQISTPDGAEVRQLIANGPDETFSLFWYVVPDRTAAIGSGTLNRGIGYWTDYSGAVTGANNSTNGSHFIWPFNISGSPPTTRRDVLFACRGDNSISQEHLTGAFLVVLAETFESSVSTFIQYRLEHFYADANPQRELVFEISYPTPSSSLFGDIAFHPSFDFISGSVLLPILEYLGDEQWQGVIKKFTRIDPDAEWLAINVTVTDLVTIPITREDQDPPNEVWLPRVRPLIAWTSGLTNKLYVYMTKHFADGTDADVGLFQYDLDGTNGERLHDDFLADNFGPSFEFFEPVVAFGPGTKAGWEL